MATRLLLLLLLPMTAFAGNRDTFPLGNQAALTAGAVTATVTDGGALFYNPAGIASHRRQRFSVNGSATMLVIRPREDVLVTNIDSDDTTSGTDVQLISAPTAATVSFPLRRNISFSAGSFVRVRDNASQDVVVRGKVPGSDVDALSAIDITGYEDELLFAAGLGWQATGWLRLGFAGYATISNRERVGASVTTVGDVLEYNGVRVGTGNQGGGVDSVVYEDSTTQIALEGGIGVQLHPVQGLRIGLSVRTHRFRIYESGQRSTTHTRFWGRPGQGNNGGPPVYEIDQEDGEGLQVRESRAPRIALGLAWEGRRWSLAADIDHTFQSEKKGLQSASSAVWNVRVGATARVNDTLWLGGGVFTDNTGRSAIETVLDDALDWYGGNFGLWMRTPVALRADERTPDMLFSSVFALRYGAGVGFVGQETIAVGPLEARDEIVQSTHGGQFHTRMVPTDRPIGHSSVVFHEISLHIGSSLEF